MPEFLQFAFSGLTVGAVYALVALGFTPIYNAGASLSDVKVGLFAWNGAATTNDLTVSFQGFHILNRGPTLGPR